MTPELEMLWLTIKGRSMILLACTISIALCTLSIQRRVDLETILWTLFIESLLLSTVTFAHCYGENLVSTHKRRYLKREDKIYEHPLLKYGFILVGLLWLIMFLNYLLPFVSYLDKSRNDLSRINIAILGTIAAMLLGICVPINTYTTYGIWYSYRTIILHTIPNEESIEMVDMLPAGAEANNFNN